MISAAIWLVRNFWMNDMSELWIGTVLCMKPQNRSPVSQKIYHVIGDSVLKGRYVEHRPKVCSPSEDFIWAKKISFFFWIVFCHSSSNLPLILGKFDIPSRALLKAQAKGMLIACITINRKLNIKPNIIQEETSTKQFVFLLINSQFRHVNHEENSDQSDRCWWNHHCNDAISSHTLTLFAYVIRSEFTKFESFWCTKIFEITFGRITLIWDDAQVSERWATDEIKRKGGYTTSSPISLSNTFYTKTDNKITFFRQ